MEALASSQQDCRIGDQRLPNAARQVKARLATGIASGHCLIPEASFTSIFSRASGPFLLDMTWS
jgi:hypothetical protein